MKADMKMNRQRNSRILSVIIFSLAMLFVLPSMADSNYKAGPITRPTLGNAATLRSRGQAIRRSRMQRYKPAMRQDLTRRLSAMDVNDPKFAAAISKAPMKVRAEVFVNKANEANTPATKFTRRLRGMLKKGKRSKVAHPQKKFIEVSADNMDLFRKVNGGNVVWFAVNNSPGHLHTILADQGKGKQFHHNVYGVTTNEAKITGNFTQYAMGVHLTDKQTDRMVRYLNAGMKHGKSGDGYAGDSGNDGKLSVYGFYRKGELVTGTNNVKCTNWATTAPIGSLPRWAKTIDKRLNKMAAANTLSAIPEIKSAGGLHAALSAAADSGARRDIINRVLAVQNMSKWNRSAVKRMAKAFNKQTADFPNRPKDLVLRASLADTMGLSRSQDPAKWSYDLMMSKRVPVVAILNGQRDANIATKEINMEIMGKIDASGRVVNGNYYNGGNLGVIPADRQPQPR